LITAVLRLHPMLCYFQGYHDIVQVLLLVLGVDDAIPAVTRISLFRIRDYMLPSLSPAVTHLRLVPAILEAADAELCQHLSQTRPFFALSATLTLYAHDIQEYSDIARLFDFLLAHEPVVSLYLFVAIILSRKKELLDIPLDEPDMLHFTLSKLPNPLDLEHLISQAMVVYEQHPPEKLPFRTWRSISQNSVLKTSRKLIPEQPVCCGEELFGKQAQELKRQELREKAMKLLWKYRKPAGSISIAVVIGVMSYWVRRTGNDRFLWSLFEKVWHVGRNGR
jgi:TBC1 domain family member 20